MGVGSHAHAQFPEKVKVSTPTNSSTAETMGAVFARTRVAFMVNLSGEVMQLLEPTFDRAEDRAHDDVRPHAAHSAPTRTFRAPQVRD